MEDSFVRLSQSGPRRSGHDNALGIVLTLSVATLVKSSRADPRLILCSPHDLFSHLMGFLDPCAHASTRIGKGLCSTQNRLQPQSSHSVFGSVTQHCRREHIHHPYVGGDSLYRIKRKLHSQTQGAPLEHHGLGWQLRPHDDGSPYVRTPPKGRPAN